MLDLWSYALHALVALKGDHLRDGTAQTKLSAPMALGRNIQISDADERLVFVPQPARGQVTEVSSPTAT